MISIRELTLEVPGKTLIKNFSATVLSRDRVGLIGRNGSGKSTLLNAIAGRHRDFAGEISSHGKITLLDQYRTFDAETPYEYYMNVADTPEKIRQVRSILKGLGFDEADWHRKINTFSGGERTKLHLGRLFIEEPDFLLLDEPTNFLDIESIDFLKKLLQSFRGGYIVVSHDRDFLRSVCNKFWEIRDETIWTFDLPYDMYHEERKRLVETQRRQYVNLQKEVERLRAIVERYKKWGREKFQRQAKSREKVLERMLRELETMPTLFLEEENKRIGIPEPEGSGYVVLEVKDVSWRNLLRNVSFTVHRGDKVAIVGPNASGKTTLLKILNGLIDHGGTVTFGHRVRPVYVEQFVDQLDLENTVFDEIFEEIPDQPDYVIRAYAGRFGFRGEDVFKTVAELSGGERQILALAKTLLRRPNLLILDEPTNHMDLETVEALEDALKEYRGSLILVSHDLELIKNVCNRFFAIKDGTLVEVDRPIYYQATHPTVMESRRVRTESSPHFEERKKQRNQLKSLRARMEELQTLERKLSEELANVENALSAETDYNEVMRLYNVKESLESELLATLERIEETRAELEKLLASERNGT